MAIDREGRIEGGVLESIEELEDKIRYFEDNREHIVTCLEVLVPRTIAQGGYKWMLSLMKYSLASKLDAKEFDARLEKADQRIKEVNALLRAGMKPRVVDGGSEDA